MMNLGDWDHRDMPYPWIGDHYSTQNPRMLVLGESHKMLNDEQVHEGVKADMVTVNTIESRICEFNSLFFSKVEQILHDNPEQLHQPGKGDEEILARSSFWHRIAFANFVPEIMPSQAIRPSREQWAAGRTRFVSLINKLSPNLVVLFSRTAFKGDFVPWGTPPNFDGLGREPVKIGDDLYRYPLASGENTLLAVFSHASRLPISETRQRIAVIRDD